MRKIEATQGFAVTEHTLGGREPMCLAKSGVGMSLRWNWDGTEIADPVIPAARSLPRSRKRRYPIDVRGFLSIEGNAVLREHLDSLRKQLTCAERERWAGRGRGSFDLRVGLVQDYLRGLLRFRRTDRRCDEWQFPEETLALGEGDCEDLSFLLAAMLRASGISEFCLRVAFGVVAEEGGQAPHDHAWVMYKDESGRWRTLEPMRLVRPRARIAAPGGDPRGVPEKVVDYVPYFVMNSHHLWRVDPHDRSFPARVSEFVERRQFWVDFDPGFIDGVHRDVFDRALVDAHGTALDWDNLTVVKDASFQADAEAFLHDTFRGGYNPIDHFDWGYIDEGWRQVDALRISPDLRDFGKAMHAVADFYSHTTYVHFAPCTNGEVPLYQGQQLSIEYRKELLPGSADWKRAAGQWKGKLLSGQFGSVREDLRTSDYDARRALLPHHDAIALDRSQRPTAHRLYDAKRYETQFALRFDCAVRHIRKYYQDWVAQHGTPRPPRGRRVRGGDER